ncbi:MAG: hypothetical protein Q8M09_16055 [Pseudomonadota bacterium]|nr:hypothetical protein [Pseudomonadota bacterium]MDP2351058.1 hypothetical protein [Pseudomonadota bacterium]
MKTNLSFLLALACVGVNPVLGQGMLMVDNPALPSGEANAITFSGGIFAANDMVPVSHFGDAPWPADYRTREGTNLAVGNMRAAFGTRRGDWSVGYFYRQDWLLKASRDTVDAHYLDQTNQLTSGARAFDLDYSLQGFSADGLRLAFSRANATADGGEWRWGVAASLMHGYDVRLEQAQGNLLTTVGSATLVGNRELFNTRLRAVPAAASFNAFSPGPAQDVPAGWGYSLDLGLSRNFRNGANLALAVNDVLGQIKWDRVPLITQNINGTFAGNTFNSGASAIVSGVNRYQSLTLDLKPKLRIEADYPLGETTLLARVEGVDGQWFPQVGISHAIASKWRVGLDYETRFGAAEISLRHANYYLALSSQSLKLNESQALGIAAGLSYAF